MSWYLSFPSRRGLLARGSWKDRLACRPGKSMHFLLLSSLVVLGVQLQMQGSLLLC